MEEHDHNQPLERAISVDRDCFGVFEEGESLQEVSSYTLKNKNGMAVTLLDYGASIQSLKVPDKNGILGDVVLGYDDIAGYLGKNNPYFGSIVGRVANRIAQGKFYIEEQLYNTSLNKETYTLHGGYKGFDKVMWNGYVSGSAVVFTYLSKDMEEGFPGDVLITARYELTPTNILRLEMKAMTTKPTPVNLTNHSYFNLAGHGCNSEISAHTIELNATEYTETDANSIPTGRICSTSRSKLDLEHARYMGELLASTGGVDDNYVINHKDICYTCGEGEVCRIARVCHPPSGRVLTVCSNQLGVQLYTANYFPKTEGINGKENKEYLYQGAFALETQNFPDAVNHTNFPNSILYPGKEYRHVVEWHFSLEDAACDK